MSEHTPGPWFADGPPDNIHILQEACGHIRICFLTSDGPTEANALLIAAAPDLLKAAQMQEAAELNRPMDCEECGGEGEPEACGSCFPPFDDARIARRLAIVKAVGVTASKGRET